MIKDVIKVSLKGKPRLWFEMQYPTVNDEPKTVQEYKEMLSAFTTEHNPIGSTKEQQIMATSIKEAMENIKTACALVGVSAQGPTMIETQAAPGMKVDTPLYMIFMDKRMLLINQMIMRRKKYEAESQLIR